MKSNITRLLFEHELIPEKGTVCVEVSNVRQFVANVDPYDMLQGLQIPAAPPWDQSLAVWRQGDEEVGFYAYRASQEVAAASRSLYEKQKHHELPEGTVCYMFRAFLDDPKTLSELIQGFMFFDPQGRLIGEAAMPPAGAPLANLTPSQHEGIRQLTYQVMVVGIMSWAFCHCKNVEVRDNRPPRKVAANRRRKGQPVITYKTLEIDPMKRVLRTEGQSEQGGLKKALHICRGHFATYTDDAPLFGRVTGTFWRPMHVRGSKKHGEVKKDYRVVANANER